LSKRRFYVIAVFLLLMAMVLAACGGDDDDQPEATVTPLPTATGVVTEEAQVTEDPSATEDPGAAPQVTLSASLQNAPSSATDGGEFYIFVSRTITENFADGLGDPPTGTRWIEIEASLGNFSSDGLTVSVDHLALVDDEGNRYPAENTEEFLNPPLVNAEIEAGNSLVGYARFAIPADVTPTALTWCYDGTCDDTIQSPIEMPE